MLHNIRSFFLENNVLEVETPALSLAGNTDPFIESITVNKGSTLRYLHTSPEYPMKRLLADGSGDIYQICKVWRAGESGSNHNPEFSMLEWYRVDYSYHQLIIEISTLLKTLLPTLNKQDSIFTYEELFMRTFNINPHSADQAELAHCVKENIKGLETSNLNKQAMLDALLTHCIEPTFNTNALTFIIDYPESQSALAQIRKEKEYSIAERFEVYLGDQELGNGYQEENSPTRNREILTLENSQRKAMGLHTVTKDENFLDAMSNGMPRSSGVAIGLDRILMIIANVKTIQEVINFPWDRA